MEGGGYDSRVSWECCYVARGQGSPNVDLGIIPGHKISFDDDFRDRRDEDEVSGFGPIRWGDIPSRDER